jgi:hypothetical protein
MKNVIASLAVLAICASAFAKTTEATKESLIKSMVTSCKAELAKEPALTETTDGETIWKNLEDKEHSQVKFSKNCHAAHEKYEHKFHKEDEESETK